MTIYRWPTVVVMLAVVGCQRSAGTPPSSVVETDSAGIRLVTNLGGDRALPWTLSRIASIGGSTAPVEMSQLTELTVDADTLGHIYVLDSWFGHRVQELDTMGALLRVLTRNGGGPGEVGQGVSISASPNGVVSIMDFAKTGIVQVDWSGANLPQISMAGAELFGGAKVLGDTIVWHSLDTRTSDLGELLQYRAAGALATIVTHRATRLGRLSFCQIVMEGLTPMLAPELRWTARGSQVASHHGAEYRIDLFHAETLQRSIRRDASPIPGTAEAVERFFPDGKVVGSPNCIVGAPELVSKRGVASAVQPLRRLAIDLDGNVWAERNTFPDEPSKVDVFDGQGHYRGTVSGHGAPLGFPARGLYLFARSDSTTNGPTLEVYRKVDVRPP